MYPKYLSNKQYVPEIPLHPTPPSLKCPPIQFVIPNSFHYMGRRRRRRRRRRREFNRKMGNHL